MRPPEAFWCVLRLPGTSISMPYVLERALQRGKRPPQLIWLKVASFGISIHKQVAVFEQPRKFGKSYAESISSRDRICRRIRIFTTKITHSAFFIEKRQQNQSACLTAAKPRILEIEKVYRTRLKLYICMVSRSQTHRYLQFQTVSVVFLRLHNFTEIWFL